MATEEDKKHKIDTWAKLFKATTWEEIKMITSTNPSMNSTAEKIFATNSDFMIAERCRIREDNIIHERRMKEALVEKDNKIEESHLLGIVTFIYYICLILLQILIKID
ncbi:hypothetical protein [Butyrivibrio fibrisolvens]|uniref:hypothetical protein n=1 Tax=Butyrivibrio fibrisolvens TaxID=831 RepID=UPI0012BBC057|nr:hypothetical protein [Butyrivibrio fibrisolvens]